MQGQNRSQRCIAGLATCTMQLQRFLRSGSWGDLRATVAPQLRLSLSRFFSPQEDNAQRKKKKANAPNTFLHKCFTKTHRKCQLLP